MPIKMAHRKSVLAVDNNEKTLEVITDFLEKDHKIIKCKDGEEAVSLYQQDKPDLVLLDIKMPVK